MCVMQLDFYSVLEYAISECLCAKGRERFDMKKIKLATSLVIANKNTLGTQTGHVKTGRGIQQCSEE